MSNIRIAIQNKGRLAEKSIEFLSSFGIQFQRNTRNFVVSCSNYPLDILYLRDDDIPEYVERGACDFGIVGENVLAEKGIRIPIVRSLGFSKCSLVIAVPENSNIQKIEDLEGERIVTSYPRILRKFLRARKIQAAIIQLKGSVEIAPNLNMADAICDLMQTGETLRENGLKSILKILDSEAVLIRSPFFQTEKFQNLPFFFFQERL